MKGIAFLVTVTMALAGFGRTQDGTAGRPSLAGHVRTSDGKPAAGATVWVGRENGLPGHLTAVADVAGRFEVPPLYPGTYLLIASHKDWAIAARGGVRPDPTRPVEVDLVLGAPAQVTGRLVDGTRQPVPGTVRLHEIGGQVSRALLAVLATSEAGVDGRFTLERLPPGTSALTVNGRGMATRRVALDLDAAQRKTDLGDIVLEPGSEIRGQLLGEDAPVAGAIVRGIAEGRPTPPLPPIEGRTEADGTFILGGAVASRYRLSVRVDGYTPLEEVVSAPSEGVRLALTTRGGISGLVVDDGDSPVESFTVTAESSRGGNIMRSVTAETGRFTLENLEPGTYRVDVATRDRGRQMILDVKVERAAVTYLGRIRLAAGGSVRGIVVDASSAPVAGAAVEPDGIGAWLSGSSDDHETTTDSAGGFELRGLRPETVVLVARHPDYAMGRSAPVKVEMDQTAEARVVLARGGTIEGVIRRRGIAAAPEMTIDLQSLSRQPFLMRETITVGPDGRFRIDHVPPGPFDVGLMVSQGLVAQPSRQLSRVVEVREGETTKVEFAWRQILLRGRVTHGGVPLPNLRLTAQGTAPWIRPDDVGSRSTGPQFMSALTREDGSYEMFVRDVGRIAISAASADGRPTRFPMRQVDVADVEGQTVDLTYPAGGISGIVVDEQTGAPIARASVGAFGTTGGPGGGTKADEDGRFAIDVDPGQFYAQANAEGYAPGGVPVTVGETPASGVRIALARGASLRGRVVDAQGRPAPEIRVMAREGTHEMGESSTSGSDGSFSFSSVRAGAYDLIGWSPLLGFGRVTDVASGTADVVLRLVPGGRIRVRATVGETPTEGVAITVRRVNGTAVWLGGSGRTGLDGIAEIAAPSGLVEIEVRKMRTSVRSEVTVEPGGLAAVEVTLSEGEAPPPAP